MKIISAYFTLYFAVAILAGCCSSNHVGSITGDTPAERQQTQKLMRRYTGHTSEDMKGFQP